MYRLLAAICYRDGLSTLCPSAAVPNLSIELESLCYITATDGLGSCQEEQNACKIPLREVHQEHLIAYRRICPGMLHVPRALLDLTSSSMSYTSIG